MSTAAENDLLQPPTNVRGMKVLDRAAFQKTISVPCLQINERKLSKINQCLKKYFLKMAQLKVVQDQLKGDLKLILLNPKKVLSWTSFDDSVHAVLKEEEISSESFIYHSLTLSYENWTAEAILKAVLPADMAPLTSYSKVGHIVHFNIRDHLLEYKYVIGQVALDKIKSARTAVNKLDKIDSTYRNFQMEILCGDEDTIVQVKENGVTYKFDFATVYWNPRLSTEHERIVKLLQPYDVLFDTFCGVGPFAIPAAKKRSKVFANDLNPESFKWLNQNLTLNKVKDNLLETFNKDAAEFICSDVKNKILEFWKDDDFCYKIHVVMNLPATAMDFLKYFKGLFSKTDVEDIKIDKIQRALPIIHVYFFVRGTELEKTAHLMFEEATGLKLCGDEYELFSVRDVSNQKTMMRLTFQMPLHYLLQNFCKDSTVVRSDEPPSKKICII